MAYEKTFMTLAQIREAVQAFAEGARRAREAGLDGVELHGANGYLITQFLSSGINDRQDEYGGSLANRARFAREIVQAIRARLGRDFHLQMKISATEFNNALIEEEGPGKTIEDSVQVCRWLIEDGIDAIVVSSGSSFPHHWCVVALCIAVLRRVCDGKACVPDWNQPVSNARRGPPRLCQRCA